MRKLLLILVLFIPALSQAQELKNAVYVEAGGFGIYSLNYEYHLASQKDLRYSARAGISYLSGYFALPVIAQVAKGNGKHFIEGGLGGIIYYSEGSRITYEISDGPGASIIPTITGGYRLEHPSGFLFKFTGNLGYFRDEINGLIGIAVGFRF